MMYDLDEFDVDVFEEIRSIMKHRFNEMIDGYIEDSKIYIDQIKEGVVDCNKEKVAQNAHPLKSSSASIGIISVANIAKDFEYKSKEAMETGADINHLETLVQPLEEAFFRAVDTLFKERN